ncbi:MAG: LptF/LptG family permease [Microscillaceae bacterium]|nr:LptF/LptG family permease [Microscillaceae bacterium]MDW8461464.1 LptF/LptG family permease [Cytophagales bacterium]
MKILDWYIFRKFAVAFVFVTIILMAVLVVIDITEKIEDFTRSKQSFYRIATEYYLNFIPHWANTLSPIIIFIAAVFVTARLASHTEIVAMLSSGVSLSRLLVPYILVSSLIAVIVFFMVAYVIPDANKIRKNFENNYLRKDKFYYSDRNVHFKLAPTLYVYLESYDNFSNIGYKFTIEHIEGTELKQKLEASRLIWNDSTKKWKLENYKIRTLMPNGEKIETGTMIDSTIAIKPKDFESKHEYEEQLRLDELEAYIAELRLRGADNVMHYVTERYVRYAYPFAIIILTIIGVIVSARKTREGAGFQIAFGFILAFLYVLLILLSRGFATQGLPPLLAAWIPNLTFCVVGLIMYWRVPK